MELGKTEARAARQALRGGRNPSGCSWTRTSWGVRGALSAESATQTLFIALGAGRRLPG